MKRLLPHFTMVTSYRVSAIALTVFLHIIGSFPAAEQAFPGVGHWTAHSAIYAVIAFTYGLGWRKRPAISYHQLRSRAGRNPRIL